MGFEEGTTKKLAVNEIIFINGYRHLDNLQFLELGKKCGKISKSKLDEPYFKNSNSVIGTLIQI